MRIDRSWLATLRWRSSAAAVESRPSVASCPVCGLGLMSSEHPVRDVDRGRIRTYHQRCAPSMRISGFDGGGFGWSLTV